MHSAVHSEVPVNPQCEPYFKRLPAARSCSISSIVPRIHGAQPLSEETMILTFPQALKNQRKIREKTKINLTILESRPIVLGSRKEIKCSA